MLNRLGQAFQILKIALAAGLAWQLATFVSQNHLPYFAPLAVILTLQATLADTLQKVLFRMGGIVVGVVVSMLIHRWLPMGAVAISLSLVVGMASCMLMRLNPQITTQVGVTALMVLVAQDTRHYAVDRVLESALGAAVAIGVNALVIPPDQTPLARRRTAELAALLSQSLSAVAGGGGPGSPPQEEMIESATAAARVALRSAQQAIKYSPFVGRRAAKLTQVAQALPALEQIAAHVRGILRGVDYLTAAGPAAGANLADALHATADCVAAFGRVVAEPGPEQRKQLEAACARAHDSQSRSFNALRTAASLDDLREQGAMLTDLRRILGDVCRT